MVGDLVMLPVRVGVRATRLWFRAVEETVSLTAGATGRVVELLSSRSANRAGSGTANGASSETLPREPARRPAAPRERKAPPTAPPASDTAARSVTTPAPATPPAEPVHVSEEPVLVEEFAEPGAEQGAGAEVHVDPPWDGYDRMTAKQVIARLAAAGSAELAAVSLYENTRRRRQTIMNAVERELRGANAGDSRANQ